jgi:hypothetical protein
MTYNNCFFCTKRYYQKKGRINKQRICDNCINLGLTTTKKPILIGTCIVCNIQYKYQTGNATRCRSHVHCYILNCDLCYKTTNSYTKRICGGCDKIILNIQNNTNDVNMFKQNYKLSLTYYDEPELEQDEYGWSDDNSSTTYHLNPLKFRNKTKLLLKNIDTGYIDSYGNIDTDCPQLRYYHGVDGYNISQVRIVKVDDLIQIDDFDNDTF